MIVAVAGTGTHVGKTTFGVALVRAFRARGARVYAWKPIETGGDSDARALSGASGVELLPAHALAEPIAPSIAARRVGVSIDLAEIADRARKLARECDVLLVETAGGLFSPVTDEETNAELVERLGPDRSVLVAADRLGVLHDVESVRRAFERRFDLLVLTGPGADASAATNGDELSRRHRLFRMPSIDSSVDAAIDLLARAEPP